MNGHRLFERYNTADLGRLFEEAGVFESLRAKGFSGFEVAVANGGRALPHVLVRADKGGRRHELLDACLRRFGVSVPDLEGAAPSALGRRESAGQWSDLAGSRLDLLLVHWVREEDPTAAFAPERPRLLLQDHPGLGVLRRAFRVAVRIAGDLGSDGVASQPKFFHDAVIFQRSRLFLFLDGREQGCFEALQRDLGSVSLRDASLAVAGWCVRDQRERVYRWQPGLQVFPVSARLTAHFHSEHYAAAVAGARAASGFHIDAGALAAARTQLGLDDG